MTTLYKYVSIGNPRTKRYKFTREIFLNSKLYMGKYDNMNDPMESFYYVQDEMIQTQITNIRNGKANVRLCCLTKSYSNILMWSHYADSHKGICIEIEIPDNSDIIKDVQYGKDLPTPNASNDNKRIVEEILSHKLLPWQYEDEVRYIRFCDNINNRNTNEYLDVQIKKVYLGCNLSEDEAERYQRLISRWLRIGGHSQVTIQQICRDELTYWDGAHNVKLI